jgi:hypothetical protein
MKQWWLPWVPCLVLEYFKGTGLSKPSGTMGFVVLPPCLLAGLGSKGSWGTSSVFIGWMAQSWS